MAKEILSENKIRPDNLSQKQNKLYEEDVKNLLKRKNEFVKVDCPACGKRNFKNWGKKYSLDYAVCNNCQTVFISPRPTPQILDDYYKNSQNYIFWNKYIFPKSEKVRRQEIFKPRAELIKKICLKHNISHNVLVDVGAGFGTFCEEAEKMKFFKKIIAVEPTPDLAKTCRKKGLEVIEKYIEEVDFKIPVDVMTAFEVIEHLFSPKDFLLGCASALKKRGIIVLTCPNIQGFDLLMLRELSKTIDAEHLNYFNPDSLCYLLERRGFKIIEVSTPGKLDAELVRKASLKGEFNIKKHPFIEKVLINDWQRLAAGFQKFLSDNLLSSHMLIVARKNK
ncbi:MAG: class I SAM-dependent methyltransferase [bacterium]